MLNFLTVFAVGGTERQFVHITRELDRSRFDVRVGCLRREGQLLKDIEALNCPISEYNIKSLYRPATLRRQIQLAADIRRDGIQLLHTYGFYPNLFAIPAARLSGKCAIVASVRDTGVFATQRMLKGKALKTVCQLADCVLANSNAVRDWLVETGVRAERIQIIPNGVVIPAPRGASDEGPIRKELRIPLETPIISVISRLIKSKGLDIFLEASRRVVDRHPDIRFLIVGESHHEPGYREELEARMASLNLGGHVIFTGERDDVPQVLRESRISVLPSLSEGFSNSILESMAMGLPVVATNVGGNPEMVRDGETGVLVPPRDPEALSQAMIRFLESPTLSHQLGQAGREWVSRNFSIESAVRKTEQLYLRLLAQRNRKTVR
jgi:glycosyltransferase involved in cell wall biosynthesis